MAAAGCRPAEPPLLRLAERVEADTVVESPLLELASQERVLAATAEHEVFHDDFESREAADYGWMESRRQPHLRRLAGGSRAWCAADSPGGSSAILLRVRPRGRYRVERSLVTEPGGPDLQVVERARSLSAEAPFNPPGAMRDVLFNRFQDLVKIHYFPPPAAGASSQGAVDFMASPATKSLMILFEPPAEATRGRPIGSCVDDLRVVRFETTPRQELALARAASPAAGRAGERGFVKRGQLLPLPRFERADPPLDANFAHRDALFAPTPTIYRFPVRVPPGGRLSFGYSLAGTARPGQRAHFRVDVEDGATVERVFAEEVAPPVGASSWPWREADVDLDRWAGREVVLRLATAAPEGAAEPVHALWAGPIVDRPRRASEPPNVLLIGLDTLRVDRLSVYGYERSTTPRLQALAAEGVRFDQAISAAPWTAPSFASVFTGLMPSAHGVVDRLTTLSGELGTMTERFRRGGWRTQAFAFKAYLFNLGFERGFDDWLNVPRIDRTADDSVAKALAFLDRHGDRRFFLFLHLDDAHEPLRQPSPWDERFADAGELERFGLDPPVDISHRPLEGCVACRGAEGVTPAYRETAAALYDGAVSFMDDRLGRLFDEMRRRRLWNDTVIAVVSDHGELLWDRGGRFGHGHSLDEEVIRAVLIIKPAGHPGPGGGRVVEQQVRLTDVAPTLLELAGLEVPAPAPDSRSLVPLMRGSSREAGEIAVSESPRTGLLGVRRDGWMYDTKHSAGRPPREALYALRTTAGEVRDELARRPDVVGPLRRHLVEHVLRNRRGLYLVALGDGSEGRWSVELDGGDSEARAMSFFGLAPELAAESRFAGEAVGTVIGLLAVSPPPDGGRWSAVLRHGDRAWECSSDDLVPARPGLLAALERRGPGLHVVETAGVVAPLAASESGENLEQLRALGYVD